MKQGSEITHAIGVEIAKAHEIPAEKVQTSTPEEPENLTGEEITLLKLAIPILDLRSENEVWRFLRCVEGLTKSLQKSRVKVLEGLCAGEIGATNGWRENDRLELRHYMPAHLAKGPRRESIPDQKS